MGHVSFSQDVFLLRSEAKSEGPGPWARAHMGPWGPLAPWAQWAHGSHGPMGPMGPMGLWAQAQGPGTGPGPFAFGARPQQKDILGKIDMPHMWKRWNFANA